MHEPGVHRVDHFFNERGIWPVLLFADGAEIILRVAIEPPNALIIPIPSFS